LKVCVTFNFKKCAFHGDPHYEKTFNAAPPHFNNRHDVQGLGVHLLAITQDRDVEIQSVQCPWHGNMHMTSAAGIAVRDGEKIATLIGATVRNPDRINFHGGGFTSRSRCVSMTMRLFEFHRGLGRYAINVEINMVDPDMGRGVCRGARQQSPVSQTQFLFSSMELRPICGTCRFACPGALLEQDPEDQPVEEDVSAEDACNEAGIDIETARANCQPVADAAEADGKEYEMNACMVDFCVGEGDEETGAVDAEWIKQLQDEDNAAALVQTSDPGDMCTDLSLNEDAKMDSPDQFKAWCMDVEKYSEPDCDRALAMLGEHPWTQDKIDQVCTDATP